MQAIRSTTAKTSEIGCWNASSGREVLAGLPKASASTFLYTDFSPTERARAGGWQITESL